MKKEEVIKTLKKTMTLLNSASFLRIIAVVST